MTGKTNLVINIMYALSTIIVLLGAFLKIMHFTDSLQILIIGFMVGALTSSYDIARLKKKIKQLEEKLKQKGS